MHNTWETRESLETQRVKGLKKLDNYLSRSQAAQTVTNSQSPEDASIRIRIARESFLHWARTIYANGKVCHTRSVHGRTAS